MSNKRFDFSVLHDGFLIEVTARSTNDKWSLDRVDDLSRYFNQGYSIRPALNYWHFNDGSMVLPDGLVCLVKYSDHFESKVTTSSKSYLSDFYHTRDRKLYVVAVKIIGAHPDYAENAKELGIKVIDI